MSRSTPEHDWKCMKKLRDDLLASLCKRINTQSSHILSETNISEYEKYLKHYDHIHESNGIIAECFDDWRRSTLMMKIYALHHNDLLKDNHTRQLSAEAQQRLTD